MGLLMENSIELEAKCDAYISASIRYLDPDIGIKPESSRDHLESLETLITLFLLLGGVIVCFATMFLHVAA